MGDKNASAKLAEGMMSLKDHPLKNVRYYILNTTYKDVSTYFEVWEGDKPLVYKFSDFVPSDDNEEEVEQDKKLWEFINSVDNFNYVAPHSLFRNKWQTEYVDTNKITYTAIDKTIAKGYNKGVEH